MLNFPTAYMSESDKGKSEHKRRAKDAPKDASKDPKATRAKAPKPTRTKAEPASERKTAETRTAADSKEVALTMSDRPSLLAATENFITDNAVIESSKVVRDVMEKIAGLSALDDVFAAPIDRRALSMDGALQFAMFLHLAAAAPVEETELDFTSANKFSLSAAMHKIESFYDEGVQATVWDHVDAVFEDPEDDGSGSEGEGEGEEAKDVIVGEREL